MTNNIVLIRNMQLVELRDVYYKLRRLFELTSIMSCYQKTTVSSGPRMKLKLFKMFFKLLM